MRVIEFDLAGSSVRALNQFLHHDLGHLSAGEAVRVNVLNPEGQHSLAAGMTRDAEVLIRGHAGYFIGGMNQAARIRVEGNVGWSVAENMMSGRVDVCGSASECAGASAHGGLLVIHGDASSRCGISLKGGDVVVQGSVGHMSAFMAQAGTIVVCGDAGPNLGDSLYEAVIYVAGEIHSLGTDAREEPLTETDMLRISKLLETAEMERPTRKFKRIASARTLYHWHESSAGNY